MEDKRLEKRLLQLPGNNPTVSPWQTVFNGPAWLMLEHHLKNLVTRASWFYVSSFNHWADFYNLTNSREDHRVPTESIYCLCWLPCCIWLSQSKSSLVDSRVDWPTQEILQTSQGAAPWDGELYTSKWLAQPILSNHDRGAPRMCSGPRALQCHHRLHYDKTTSHLSFGLKFGDHTISYVDFANDLAILADSMEQLLEVLQILQEEAAKVGLHINWNKTKIMAIILPIFSCC